MKQKVIIFCIGLFTGLIIWFAYDRIDSHNSAQAYIEYLNQYENDEFLAEKKEQPFDAEALYKMKLTSKNGKEVSIKNNENIVFLNFWATWCKPCIEEMPSIQELYDKSENVDFYLLTYEDIDKATEFIENKGFSFPIYSYKDKTNLPLFFQENGGSIPDTYIIHNNEIKFHHLGAAPWNSKKVDSLFSKILKKNN
ncbi:TlpA disulfide reductase family protein [uncultured Psychroserpens sp.]|uniref:TlpA family protein disulfide reductase n=1 Tax=uncultured Psychroserpens sp. TaxID=255436 RepID=UPI00262539FB|nr:TlpA disulfide reductase family protein [uncultured Psychroserpens sp.]